MSGCCFPDHNRPRVTGDTERGRRKKMGLKPLVVTVLLTVAVAYYIYLPLPDAIQQPWKLMVLDAGFRSAMHLVRDGGVFCFVAPLR